MDDGWLRRAVAHKRDGGALAGAVWERIVAEYVAGTIDDAPVAALAMACTVRGMREPEIVALTEAMIASGEGIGFPAEPRVVDKHSSGGVGDTVSLIVVPLVAACGVPVAKLAGRALGHTGGTLDKLEAIPGVRTDLAPERFVAQVERIGCAIAAQSDRLVPADGKLYALRDRTATVPSIGLIAASIVSKKVAGGAHAFVFDVKAGRGALVRNVAAATDLADVLVRLAARFGRGATAIVSDMEEPLGITVGTGIEALEARDFLRGDARDARLREAVLAVAHEMLRQGGVPDQLVAARVDAALGSGAAYERFAAMLHAQGAGPDALERIAVDPRRAPVLAQRSGYVGAIDAFAVGELARELTAADGPFAGISIRAVMGTAVRRGDLLAEIHGAAVPAGRVARAFTVTEAPPPPRSVVAAVLRDAALLAAAKGG